MRLNTDEWKPFYLKNLYDIQMGNGFDKNKLDENTPEINLVSRVSYNNGVDVKVGRVDGVAPFDAGLVTVALGGSYLGSCFVQEEPFYTAQNVAVMKAKYEQMSQLVNTFISGLVRFECHTKYYAFGRELNTHIRTDFDIKLPIVFDKKHAPRIDETHEFSEEGYIPDWQYIEEYMLSLHHKRITTSINHSSLPLDVSSWKEFKVSSILTIHNGKGITSEEIEENPGDFNAVQSGEDNNGILGKINKLYCYSQGYTISEKPCLTVARSGSAGFVSFQIDGCVVGDSAKILLLDDDVANVYTYLFVQTLLTANRFKYAYGRKVTESKYLSDTIKLPILIYKDRPVIDSTKRFSEYGYIPDWKYMENYIKSLPYGDRL